MRGRAFRRAAIAKRKEVVKRRLRRWDGWAMDMGSGFGVVYTTPRRVGMMANTRKACSCSGCGNPRRHFGELSIQERRNPL